MKLHIERTAYRSSWNLAKRAKKSTDEYIKRKSIARFGKTAQRAAQLLTPSSAEPPLKKGQKKHTYEDLLKYMKMIEQGYSIYHIHKEYVIKDNQLRTLWAKYQEKGPNGLLKRTNLYVDLELKMQIIEEIEKNI